MKTYSSHICQSRFLKRYTFILKWLCFGNIRDLACLFFECILMKCSFCCVVQLFFFNKNILNSRSARAKIEAAEETVERHPGGWLAVWACGTAYWPQVISPSMLLSSSLSCTRKAPRAGTRETTRAFWAISGKIRQK